MIEELDLFDQPIIRPEPDHSNLTIEQQFDLWKSRPGSRLVLRQLYRYASHYAKDFRRYGKRVSMKLIWELTRHHIGVVKARAKASGVDLKQWQGYTLNNNFHALCARHIVQHRTEWVGMFETRMTAKEREQEKLEQARVA